MSGTVIIASPFPTFACDSSLYSIGDTTFSKFSAANPAAAVALNATIGNGNGNVNGLGYNVLDNYMYTTIVNGSDSQLVRISGAGTSVVLNDLTGITTSIRGGDIDANGVYWLFSQVTDSPITTWYSVNLNPASALFGTVTASGTATLAGYNAYDWTVSNVPGRLVSFCLRIPLRFRRY